MVSVRSGRVLLVDEEENVSASLGAALRSDGFVVHSVGTGHRALVAVEQFDPDLVVLEVLLPDLDGLAVVRRLRAAGSRVGVLFLSRRGTAEDRISGLWAGADDYLAKPFTMEEAVLRIRAIGRRTRPEPDGQPDSGMLRYADLELDEIAHQVRRRDRLIELSPTEFDLLRCLMANGGRAVSRARIMEQVWNSGVAADDRIIESYVCYLRRKIDRIGPPLIHTVRGLGYKLQLPAATSEPAA